MLQDFVNGSTKKLGIFGNPIEHTLSPIIHNSLSKHLGNNFVYIPFKVLEENLEQSVQSAYCLDILGINITVPHKNAVIPFLASVDRSAELVGAVNTLKYSKDGYVGYNTDVHGIQMTLEKYNIIIKDRPIAVVGAGGGARSALAAVAGQNPCRIFLINRTLENANTIAKQIKKYYNIPIDILTYDDIDKISELELLIQSTSVGLDKAVSPIEDQNFFNKVKVAFDIIYKPWETEFLKLAKNAGCVCINGFDMLIYQAVKSYEIWTETKIDTGISNYLYDNIFKYFKGVNNA